MKTKITETFCAYLNLFRKNKICIQVGERGRGKTFPNTAEGRERFCNYMNEKYWNKDGN